MITPNTRPLELTGVLALVFVLAALFGSETATRKQGNEQPQNDQRGFGHRRPPNPASVARRRRHNEVHPADGGMNHSYE